MPLDSAVALVDALLQGHLLEPEQLDEFARDLRTRSLEPRALAGELIRRSWLTPFQANQLLQGRGGELLLGSYVLLERIGEGGMGAYKARNWKLGRVVALKVIRKERLASEDAVRRFHREIRAAAALSHPNIVMAYDADEVNGTHFFAMECVEGSDLAKLIKQHGSIPIAQACDWVRQAAVGLQHAHERGMVHRDIKPHNLLLNTQGAVKILDMGLARLSAEDGEASTTMTQEGMVMGTPDYMAPEQAEQSHTVDIRADIYSLGCTLYHLLTGKVPFPGGTLIQKLKNHQSNQPAPLEALRPETPQAVCDIVYKLMAKRPEDRYQTPAEVAAVLADEAIQRPDAKDSRTVAVSEPVRVVPATRESVNRAFDFQPMDEATEVVRAARRRTEKRRLLLVALAGGFVLLALTVGLWSLLRRPATPTAPSPVAERTAKPNWQPGPAKDVLPGLIARPARLPGFKRWQIETNTLHNDDRAFISGSNRDFIAVSWSPDGKFIAYGGEGRGVRILDAASRRLVRKLFGHEEDVLAVAWSPDGKWLASASLDKTVRLWRADGTPGPVLKGHTDRVTSVAWSPDGKRLASGCCGGDGTIRLWAIDGTPGPILKQESAVFGAVAWSPDGKILASTDGVPRLIRLWNTADGTQRTPLGPLPRAVSALAWSPNGKHLASNSVDSAKDKVAGWIWDVAQRKQTIPLQYDVAWLNWLGWSSQGKLAAMTTDDMVVIIDPQNGKIISSSPGGPFASASWSPDGRQIAGSTGRILNVAKDGRLTLAWEARRVGEINVAWSPDGKRLASASWDKTVRVWMSDGRVGPVLEGHTDRVYSVAWSPDSKRLASASADLTVRLWGSDGRAGPILKGHNNEVVFVTWSLDGKRLASASWDGTVRLWGSDGSLGPVFKGHEATVTCVAWSPDGKWLASSSSDKTVRLWHADGTPGPVKKHEAGTQCVSWSPDGSWLASADWGGEIRLWRADGTPGPVMRGPPKNVMGMAWSPDSKWLASAMQDGTVRLWTADGLPGSVLKRHDGEAISVAWSPDGKHLASGGTDSTIQVSSAKGEPELTIVLLPEGRSATFSAAGELLYGDADAIEQELVYLVEQSDGRIEVLRPSAFQERVKLAEKAAGR